MESKSYDQIKESCQEIVQELKSRDDGYAVEVKRKLRTLVIKMSNYLKGSKFMIIRMINNLKN